MDALKLIKGDHERLTDLLEEALDTDEPSERADLLHRMRAELMAHEQMEETIFYPALRSDANAKDIVLEGYEEHHVIDLILDELLDVPEELDEWKAKLKVLKENVEHHIEEEEGEMFKIARKVFDDETLEELGKKMHASKEAATA
jgi:iron-sulfur cluster repair protein YtfE (RIC family)